MDFSKLFDSGVAIGVIIYFMYRDSILMSKFTEALNSMKSSVDTLCGEVKGVDGNVRKSA